MKLETDVDLRSATFDNGVIVTFSTCMAAHLIGTDGPMWQSDLRQSLDTVFDQANLTEAERAEVVAHLLT